MSSALMLMVVRFLLSKLASGLPMDSWKSETKQWIFEVTPGTWADAAAWSVVEGAWDLIISECLKQAPLGLASNVTMDQAWGNSAEVLNRLQLAQSNVA